MSQHAEQATPADLAVVVGSASSRAKLHGMVDALLPVLVCITVSMEFMLSSSGGTTLSELVVYLGAIAVGLRWGVHKRPAHLVFVLCIVLAVATLMMRGWDRVYAPYLKTFFTFAAATIVWDHLTRHDVHRVLIFRLLTLFGTAVAAYSILQALLGFGVLPDVYQLGGVPQVAQAPYPALAGELYRLLGVMRWKAALINDSIGFDALNGLGYGLHWFSVNMAEYLVFASIAGWMALGCEHGRFGRIFFFQILLASAIVLSGSRTALLGFAFVNASLFYICAPKWRPATVFLGGVTLALGALFFDWTLFFFDNGGTVAGRGELNMLALSYATFDALSVLLGGNAAEFARVAYSNVHFTFLYYWLHGGIFVALAMFGLFLWWIIIPTTRLIRSDNMRERVLYCGCIMALIWFIVYGFTWTAVALPNTVILVSLFASLGTRRRVADYLGAARTER